ncbi:MAG TPA: hypothetical protein IAB18_02315 [Candidatus Avisuccinivibrio pullicola]|nr:hypothetical protein [Candidatus Avisuccinivibrio pullicola]
MKKSHKTQGTVLYCEKLAPDMPEDLPRRKLLKLYRRDRSIMHELRDATEQKKAIHYVLSLQQERIQDLEDELTATQIELLEKQTGLKSGELPPVMHHSVTNNRQSVICGVPVMPFSNEDRVLYSEIRRVHINKKKA